MRFLFFAAQYLPTAGGVERYTHNLAKTLVAAGHSATVVTSALPGLAAEETDEAGIRIFRLPARLWMAGRFPVPRGGKAFRRLSARLWENEYDFALINTRFYPLSLWAARQCRRRHLPAIVLEHGTKHLDMGNQVLNLFGGWYEHAAMHLMRRYCDDFYGVSLACSEWLRHFGVTAKGVLYNAVDPAELKALTDTPATNWRQRLGLAADAPLVAFVGRFIAEKGIWEMLDAFAILQGNHPAAALVMAGDGPLHAQAAQKKAPGVFLPGQVSYAESIALLHQADVFCLPTYSEGFSTTVLEAAVCGSFIVTTPTGGSPELICDGKSGILLDSIAPAAIAGALARALDDAALRKAAAVRLAQRVEEHFTWRRTTEALLEISQRMAHP
ncbi:glycosyltransferase family 4 protein [Ruminococcaceae bacterium OttesenSCG-928-O06]|nr:glycosyltransferase family 4 protein [Ruminococcaceae bacterium OttesenSCG-928-O06]